jgi:uncharacterized repeat protein (TIGR01451 family)
MKKMKNILFKRTALYACLCACIVLLLSGTVFADIYGTQAGTTITAPEVTISANAGTALTSNPQTLPQVTVDQIYGIDQSFAPFDLNAGLGGSVVYQFRYENKGNGSDSLSISKGNIVYGGTSGGAWSVGSLSNSGPALLDIGEVVVTFGITTATDARNSSTGTVTINAVSAGWQGSGLTEGSYTGYNLNVYGDIGQKGDIVITTIQGPVINISSRVATATAPAGYSGAGDAPVPGAKVTYTLQVQNSGDGNASGLKIIEPLSGDMDYLLNTMSNDQGGTLVYKIGTTEYSDGGSGVTENVNSLIWEFDLAAGNTATLEYELVIP